MIVESEQDVRNRGFALLLGLGRFRRLLLDPLPDDPLEDPERKRALEEKGVVEGLDIEGVPELVLCALSKLEERVDGDVVGTELPGIGRVVQLLVRAGCATGPTSVLSSSRFPRLNLNSRQAAGSVLPK